MSQVLNFVPAPKRQTVRLRVVPRDAAFGDFLPEVLRRVSVDEETVADPADAPKQVLSEALALFSAVAVLVLALTPVVPGPWTPARRLPYEAVRTASDPRRTLLDFLESTYAAAADLGAWDRAGLECAPGQVGRPRPVWGRLNSG